MPSIKQIRKSNDHTELLPTSDLLKGFKVPVLENDQPFSTVLIRQTRLLLWKRYCESTKTKLDVLKVAAPPLLFFLLAAFGSTSRE
eukprot:gene10002-10867_t